MSEKTMKKVLDDMIKGLHAIKSSDIALFVPNARFVLLDEVQPTFDILREENEKLNAKVSRLVELETENASLKLLIANHGTCVSCDDGPVSKDTFPCDECHADDHALGNILWSNKTWSSIREDHVIKKLDEARR